MKYKHIGMTTFSVQQTTRLAQALAFAGTLVGIELDQEILAVVIGSAVSVIAWAIGHHDRYKKGDINIFGKRI